MSGTRIVQGKKIKLLADYPIDGPTNDQTIVDCFSSIGIGHRKTKLVLGASSVTVTSAGPTQNFVLGATPIEIPLIPVSEQSSGYVAAYSSMQVGLANKTIQFNGAQYAYGQIVLTLIFANDVVVAPPLQTFELDILVKDSNDAPVVTTKHEYTVIRGDGTQDVGTATCPIFMPYDNTNTHFSILISATPLAVQAGHSITIQIPGSYILLE